MKKTTLFILLLCASLIYAQEDSYIGVEAKQRTGFLLPHRTMMAYVPKDFAMGFDLTVYYQTRGKSEYHALFNYPKYGLTFIGSTLGNNKILGNLFGVFAFGDFPFYKNEKNEFSGSFGIGLAVATKRFDAVKNPRNGVLGTHLNALINLSLKYRYYFPNDFNLVAGVELTHASNGAYRMPNLGANLFYPSLGIGYQLKDIRIKSRETVINFNKRWKYSVMGVLGFKETYPIGGDLFPVGGLSFIVTKRFTPLSGIELYADGFYKTSIYQNPLNQGKTRWNVIQAGIFAAYNLHIDKLRVHVGLGAYVYDKFSPDGLFYSRLGIKYQFTEHFFVNLGLKSHWAKADYVEYGVGVTF